MRWSDFAVHELRAFEFDGAFGFVQWENLTPSLSKRLFLGNSSDKICAPVNLPNSITLSRLVLTLVFIVTASMGTHLTLIIALVSFLIATISDWLDGYLARKLNLVTALGKLLDPLADKILVASAFVYFTSQNLCPVWVTSVIIGREFLVTGLRQIAIEQGTVIAADRLGKWKTSLQLAFGITSLVWLITEASPKPLGSMGNFFARLSSPENFLFPAFLWGSLILTLLSGLNYLKASWNLLIEKP